MTSGAVGDESPSLSDALDVSEVEKTGWVGKGKNFAREEPIEATNVSGK